MADHSLRNKMAVSLAFVAAVATLAPRAAEAQWSERPTLLSLPSGQDRWGITAGSFRIWPRLTTEGRYDSNLFRADVSETSYTDAAVLRILPGVTIVNPNPRAVRFYLDVAGDVRLYFGDSDAVEEQRDVGVTATMEVDLFPRGPVTLRVFDRFRRALQTRNWATAGNFNRNFNLAGLQGLFKPGGGALEFGVEYAFGLDIFDEYSQGNLYYHDIGFHTLWKFYPMTAVFVDVDFKIVQYDAAFASTTLGMPNVDSKPLRAVAGLSGYITKRLAVLIQAGWGVGFYDTGESFSGPIGLARVSYRVTRTTLLQIGYARDYEDSIHGNYYAEHRIFFSGQQSLWERLDIKASASFHILDYAAFEPPATADFEVSQGERAEQALKLGLSLHVDATRWLAFDAGYTYEALFSDYNIRQRGGPVVDVPTYYRHQVYASVTGRY